VGSSQPTRIWYQSFTDPDVDAPYFGRLSDAVQSAVEPSTEVDVHGIQPGDRYLHPITEFRCAATVIKNALTAVREGYDAFVIGHFQEPGLGEVRAAIDIPVIGLGESTMLYGCQLGRGIGLVTINPIFIPCHEDQVRRYGLEQRVRAIRSVDAQVADYNRAFDDQDTYERMRDDFVRQVEPMVDLGLDVIVPAGGYPMLLFSRERNLTIRGASVLNGLPVAVMMAEVAVRLRRQDGTSTSRRSTFALPVTAAVEEFGLIFGRE
jgi:Asp/Glu/hydantoin racemase